MGSVLVVANQTLGGEALSAHLRRLIDADPSVRFVVVVPVPTPVLDVGGAMGAMSGVTMIDAATQDRLNDLAKDRLRVVLEWLRGTGAEAEGTVVSDPMVAMQAAVAAQTFDEIVISTLPARVSGWLRQDLAHRAARKFSVPVTTITAADDTMPPADAPVATTTPSITPSAPREGAPMAESVYKIVELVGTSTESWEKAAAAAVTRASETLRDLRVAEVAELDLVIENGVVSAYRAKVKVSFKYEGERGFVSTESATRAVNAPAERVWTLISDVTRMGEWSPETTAAEWLGGANGPAEGVKFRGTNRNGKKSWKSVATIVDAVPGRAFAFRVKALGLNVAEWRYSFEPTPTGCVVTEEWIDRRGGLMKAMSPKATGVADRAEHNRAGMEQTLERLAAAAEATG